PRHLSPPDLRHAATRDPGRDPRGGRRGRQQAHPSLPDDDGHDDPGAAARPDEPGTGRRCDGADGDPFLRGDDGGPPGGVRRTDPVLLDRGAPAPPRTRGRHRLTTASALGNAAATDGRASTSGNAAATDGRASTLGNAAATDGRHSGATAPTRAARWQRGPARPSARPRSGFSNWATACRATRPRAVPTRGTSHPDPTPPPGLRGPGPSVLSP